LLRAFLDRHDAGEHLPAGHETDERRSVVRAAVIQSLTGIADAYRHRAARVQMTVGELTTTIRRWLGAQTIATTAGTAGVHIVDAQAARFGDFDDVQLVGLVEGEWPELPRRSIFYPASLLALLEPGPAAALDLARRERDGLRAARASFRDLVGLARRRVRASSFALEADAVVEPSTLIDDLEALALTQEIDADTSTARIFPHEALAMAPSSAAGLPPLAAAWARLRLDRARGPETRFQGEAGPWILPRVSVSRVDRYLDCPFRFYASEVLKLEEEPEDEDLRTPLERGRFLHDIFETFFREWQASGRGRITPADVPAARARLHDVCERALAALPLSEGVLERARLLGSAAGAGIVERVLALEAAREDEVRERLIEVAVEGPLRFRTASGDERVISLNAKVDRVDLLADGGFRLIDYKSKYTPDVKRKVQLPIYSSGVRQRLRATLGRDAPVREALYLSLEGDRAVVPLKGRAGMTLDEVIAEAEDRFLQALDAIAAGHFPPQPTPRSLCNTCPYVTVCRKAIVERPSDAAEPDAGRADDE
jgi:RecB family exonuclease